MRRLGAQGPALVILALLCQEVAVDAANAAALEAAKAAKAAKTAGAGDTPVRIGA